MPLCSLPAVLFENGGQAPLIPFLPLTLSASSTSSIIPAFATSSSFQPESILPDVPAIGASISRPTPNPVLDLSLKLHADEALEPSQDSTSTSIITSCNNSVPSMWRGRRFPCALVSTILGIFTFSGLHHHFGPKNTTPTWEKEEEAHWMASSNSWLDRTACKWLGVCGAAHLDSAGWTWSSAPGSRAINEGMLREGSAGDENVDLSAFWKSATSDPNSWSEEERLLRDIPQYVLDHAPYVHLYSGEQFWPCDIAEHLLHTTPYQNYTLVQPEMHPNLTNLDDLNRWGRFVYLHSNDNVEERPNWLGGKTNIPESPDDPDDESWAANDGDIHVGSGDDQDDGQQQWAEADLGDTIDRGGIRLIATNGPVPSPADNTEREELVGSRKSSGLRLTRRDSGGRSDAPAVLIVVDKGDGVVDAFWFYFYSYNLGNVVLNVRFGNHIGDWEHSVVRFHHGKPKAVYLSEHNFGEAYSYAAVEKIGKRPVTYSSTGTHAMYATPGRHPYILPWGLLHDETDRGPLWDPALNFHSFTYDYLSDTLRSSTLTPHAPIGWFYYNGHWGDKFYKLSDPRQYRFYNQYHYVNGPLGPRFKNLGRKRICQGNGHCIIKHWIGDTHKARLWEGPGEGEEMSDEDIKRFGSD